MENKARVAKLNYKTCSSLTWKMFLRTAHTSVWPNADLKLLKDMGNKDTLLT